MRLDSMRKIILGFSGRIKQYFNSYWNWFDVFGIILFVIGFILRFISTDTNETWFYAAK